MLGVGVLLGDGTGVCVATLVTVAIGVWPSWDVALEVGIGESVGVAVVGVTFVIGAVDGEGVLLAGALPRVYAQMPSLVLV